MKVSLVALLLLIVVNCRAQSLDPRVQKLFRDSILFFNQNLRNQQTGQCLDFADLNGAHASSSSVGATGMGLISLAVGDATKTLPNAYAEALMTLRFVAYNHRYKQR